MDTSRGNQAGERGQGQPDWGGPTTCDEEAIHVPGSIQPHGVLLALDELHLTIAQASVNTDAVLGIEAAELLGAPVSRVFASDAMARLAEAARGRSMRRVNPLRVDAAGRTFDVVLHRVEGLLVLELEPRSAEEDDGCDTLFDDVTDSIDRLQAAPTIAELGQAATEEVGRLTGYDRVMVYRFHADGHGEVIAETRDEALEPYLHLHYPAYEIPAQARRLYAVNRSRQIVDARYQPVALVPCDNPLTRRPLDLSGSVLRSVSPWHLQYLQNMGVRASMSFSLVRDGALWGLIACHHTEPRHVDYRRRKAGEFLGEVLAWQIEVKERQAHAEARLRASQVGARLVEEMSAVRDLGAGLAAGSTTVTDLVEASGVAIRDRDGWIRRGATPAAEELDALAPWLSSRCRDGVYATDSLVREHPPFGSLAAVASGVLAIAFPDAPVSLVAWFRPEVVQTVSWAGDPNPQLDPDARLVPRASFREWRELVRFRSIPWSPWEIDAARDLRGAIIATFLTRAAELERLNRELREAVRVRDDFMSMASHELRTPIFTLGLQVDGMHRAATRRRETFTPELALSRIEVAKRQVTRLEQLVGGLLDFSKISAGRLTFAHEQVQLSSLLDDVVARFGDDLAEVGCTVAVRERGELVGWWDPVRLDQVITNLLSNAIKYGAGKPIEVEAVRVDQAVRLTVKDHGIGIPADAQARIFERFERAVSPAHYSGFGLGLWIVRHIVERLGGTVGVRSELGKGATFIVELPVSAPALAEERLGGAA